MRELELDGIHDDGEHVVLTDSDGAQYSLRMDEALRAAVRRDRPALGMIQSEAHASLRPREIQAMLRAGRGSEEIADIAGLEVDRVRRYEGPVLAERSYTAERARTFRAGRGGGPVLEQLVTERLRARAASEDVAWDAWRRPDGSWTLELAFQSGGRERLAHWVADLDAQQVSPEDDEARWLTDADSDDVPEPPRARGRLSAVRSRVYDVEADGGVEHETPGSRMPWSSRPSRREHPAAIGDAELDALNARRGLRPVRPSSPRGGDAPGEEETTEREGSAPVWSTLDEPSPAAEDHPGQDRADQESSDESRSGIETITDHRADSDAIDDRSRRSEPSRTQVQKPDAAQTGAARGPAGKGSEEASGTEDVDRSQLTPLPGFDEDDAAKPAPKKTRPKRSSIPSWDEIVFGSKND